MSFVIDYWLVANIKTKTKALETTGLREMVLLVISIGETLFL